MNEKTEELRDVFIDATGADTVTEQQEETPGSLTDRDEAAVAERLGELVATMRERYEFRTDLDDDAYERVVRGFHEDDDDEALAESLGVTAETVWRARLDCHLVREADREGPVDYADLKRAVAEIAGADTTADPEAVAAELETDVDSSAMAPLVAVAEVELISARANGRFRDEFRDLLTDAAISDTYADDAREDGLRDATEDIETDVSL